MKLKDGFKGSRSFVFPHDIVKKMEEDPFAKDLHITDIGYYPVAHYHYRERSEGCDQFVLLYCVAGKGWCKFGNQRYELRAHQFIVLPIHTTHAYGADVNNPWSIYWIHFAGEKAPYFAGSLNKITEISPTEHSRIEERIDLFEEMFVTLERGYQLENIYYAITCLYHFLGSLVYLNQYREYDKTHGNVDAIEKSVHYMQENIERKVTLKELAEEVSYSPSHYSALFHSKMGYSPLNYFMRLKIQKACRLLEFGNMKVNQVAFKLGFDDPFYFCRVFTKIMGIAPIKFRNR